MTITEYIETIAPQFIGVDLTGVIEIAQLRVSQYVCPEKRDLIVAYLAAHIKTLAERGNTGADGDVNSLSEGGLSISYSNITADINNNYSSTSYGREYELLIRACTFSARTRQTNEI